MPYNLFVTLHGQPGDEDRLVLKDLSKDELLKRVVKPFRRGQNMLVADGEVIASAKVRRLKITLTDEPLDKVLSRAYERSEQHRRELNQRSRSLVFLGGVGLVDAHSHGQDVTAQFIKEAPDAAPTPGLLERIAQHPWTLAILAAVLAFISGWYLK